MSIVPPRPSLFLLPDAGRKYPNDGGVTMRAFMRVSALLLSVFTTTALLGFA